MTDIEQKALALINSVNIDRGYAPYDTYNRQYDHTCEALCRAIERHEAFRQEVSDAAEQYNEAAAPMGWEGFDRFIIQKPDPLVAAAESLGYFNTAAKVWADDVRAALEERGLEIREKGQ